MLPILAASLWLSLSDPRLTINGLPWLAENQHELIRLPRRLQSTLPPEVWNLGLSPSGGRIRFRSNSTRLAIRLEYPSPPNMANMHAFGQTGVDLYLDGVYRSTATAPKDATKGKTTEFVFFADLPAKDREITLYLSLYKPVTIHGLAIDEVATLTPATRFARPQPIVYYGTSITQGGCASRSGLSYQAILGRQLNLDFVNLGFSGNGKGEPAVASMVAELNPALFVLDFSQNNPTLESLQAVYQPFLETLRTKHPKTPVLAITPIAAATDPARLTAMRQHIRKVIEAKIAAGDKNLTLLDGLSLLGPADLDGLVDGVHPNDLGFQRMADRLAPTVANILRLPPPVLADDRQITLHSPAALRRKREELIEFIWGPAGFPKTQLPAKITKHAPLPIANLQHAKSVETFTIRMDSNQENTTHHLLPRRPNGQLVILHHGHSCTFDDATNPKSYGMAHATDKLLEAGYAVLLAYMPHLRPGDCGNHADLTNLKYFLEPVAISLNQLRRTYRQIHMAGLSGGGWTTTLYAALDPTIQTSFPIAGSIPLYLRTGGSVGDWEQYLPSFYRLAGYPDLYVLGSSGRKQIQILNRQDDCCFGQNQHQGAPYEEAYRQYERAVQQALGQTGHFELVIDDTAPRHMISPAAVETMLKHLASSK